MRKISLWLFVLVFTASLARAQDDAAQQQIDKLSGQLYGFFWHSEPAKNLLP